MTLKALHFQDCVSKVEYRESVVGSIIQATGTVEFENGLQMVLRFNQGRCTHLGSPRGRLNSDVPGSAWLLDVKPGTGFDSRQLQF